MAPQLRSTSSRSAKSQSPSTTGSITGSSNYSDQDTQSDVSSYNEVLTDSASAGELGTELETTQSESASSHSAPPRKKQKLSSVKHANVSQAKLQVAAWNQSKLVIVQDSTDSDAVVPKKKIARAKAKKRTASIEPESNESSVDDAANKPQKAKYQDNFKYANGIDESKPPLSTIPEMFGDLTRRTLDEGLDKFLNHLAGRPLVVATMMSGTESPIITLNNVAQHLKNSGRSFNFTHVFSAEIEHFKQNYILRNFPEPIVFRDVVELNNHSGFATTAYGGRAKIPGNVDVLVAGFCCVDFSPLNNQQKTLEARGESGDTFFSIIAYAKDYCPKMIILENLTSVPWSHEEVLEKQKKIDKDKAAKEAKEKAAMEAKEVKEAKETKKEDKKKSDKNPGANRTDKPTTIKSEPERVGLDKHFEGIGYRSIYIRVDTKDHYIPHTRVRGYMVAVHEASFPDPEKLDVLLKSWKTLIKKLKSPASVPVDAMVMASDDPRLRIKQKVADSEKKMVDWERCKTGHHDYRAALGLGTRHPLSNWSSDGYVSFPDFFKPYIGRTERVFDSLEIAHLRNVRRGFDDRYFSRFYELSQNVFRVTDTTRQGIIGCLTPTGIPWSSVRGGKLTGQEALMLQGLPVDQLDLDQLTQSNLQDFSGNAMTSTVVGTAMLAAFVVFYKVFDSGDTAMQTDHHEKPIVSKFEGEYVLEKAESCPTTYKPISVDKLLSLAEATRRLCYCEGRHEVLAKSFQQCTTCKHTTCMGCGKTPKHHYIPIPKKYLEQRQDPCVFEQRIKKSIPMKLELAAMASAEVDAILDSWPKICPDGFTKKEWLNIVARVKAAFKSSVFFRSCRRAEIWEVIYDSADAKVVLQISHPLIEWLVYANVPKEPLGTSCGKFLRKQPLARMRPTGKDIAQGPWEFWLPERREFVAEITSEGQLVQSFESYCGLEAFADNMVMTKCLVDIPEYDENYFDSDIRGEYQLSQDCGQAFNSLHVKKDTIASVVPTFFFFDHYLQTGDPKLHSFVFTHTTRRMDYGEHRPLLATVDNKWRQPKVLGIDPASQSLMGSVETDIGLRDVKRAKTTIRSEGRWVELGHIMANRPKLDFIAYGQFPSHVSTLRIHSCQSAHAVFTCKAPVSKFSEMTWLKDQWTAIDRTTEEAFFREFSWAFEKGAATSGHREADKNWQIVKASDIRCRICAPQPPRLLWAFSKAKHGKLAPYEEPEEATSYEHAMKKRPSPIEVISHISCENEITLKVGVNPVTLVHRAVARLEVNGISKRLTQSWRIITDDGRNLKPILAPFKLMNTKSLEMASQPPNFSKKLLLREFQRSSLTWMLQQERPDTTFTEQEVCEARVRQLGYRLEGKATREVRALGGVLAHDVGFGKTALILALIDTLKSRDMRRAQDQNPSNGAIPLKATIIIVPPHLLDQWESEISRFLPRVADEQLLVIKSMPGFQKLNIGQWMKAEIVLVSWKLCESPTYTSGLAQFAGMMEPDEHSTARALDSWYDGARAKVASNVEKLAADPKNFQSHLKLETRASEQESMALVAPVPSKRTKGASYKSFVEREIEEAIQKQVKTKLKLTAKDTAAQKSLSAADFKLSSISKGEPWTAMTFPLLEMFNFARVVIDEYTYVSKGEGRILEHIKANSRWILSGTPSLSGFWHIKKMAKLLGINLGIDDYASLPDDVFKAAKNEMTGAEEARIYGEDPSPAWHEHRHLLCQKFLDQYVRKDLADVSDIFCSEHMRLIRQSPAEKAIYLELVQTMAAVDFMPKGGKATGKEIDRHLDDALANCTDGKEALLLRASHFAVFPETAEVNEDVDVDEDLDEDADKDLTEEEPGGEGDNSSSEDSIIATAEELESSIDHGKDRENAPKACEIVVQSRRRHYDQLMNEFCHTLMHTYWLHRNKETKDCDYYTKWQERIRGRTYGDIEICEEVRGLIAETEEAYDPDNWTLFYYKGKEPKKGTKLSPYPTGLNNTHGVSHLPKMVFALRTMATRLNTFMGTLVKRKRALRLMETVLAVQSVESKSPKAQGGSTNLSCSKCHSASQDAANIVILTQCGHIVCRKKCLSENMDECPVQHCNASVKKYHQTLASDLVEGNACGKLSPNGEKLDAIVSLIECIPQEEKIIVFVQSTSLIEKVMGAVGARMLYADIESLGKDQKSKKANSSVRRPFPGNARDLAAFQHTGPVGKTVRSIAGPRVLILNIGTEAASGLNLTMANHIIFVAPYYTKGSNSQHDYEAAMTQAIGRARRYGQNKPVHIYHFMTCHTIDVDILEYRTSRLVKPVAAMVPSLPPHNGFIPSKLELVERHEEDMESTFGSAIAHMLFGGGSD